MTTLEIVRLDSSSPHKSPNHTSNVNNRISSHSNKENSKDHLQEIPINILKSPSFSNSQFDSPSKLNTKTPILLCVETLSPEETKRFADSLKSMSDPKSLNANKTNSTSSLSIPAPASPPEPTNLKSKSATQSTTSSSQFNSSDDIDYVINTNSATLANQLEAKSNTLRFNKYGFIQPEYSTNTLSGDLTSKRSSVNNNAGNSLSKKEQSGSQQINGANSLASLTDKSFSTNDELNSSNNNNSRKHASNSQLAITNLKDYIQNTDVEEFAEKLPIEVVRAREQKWIDMLANFNEWMKTRFKKIKSRCRKGIPQSMRSRAWMSLTGAFLLKQQKPNYYNECVQNVKKVDINKYLEDIKKDLHRQFPSHEIFMKKEGRQMLFNVLKAYAVHNKEVGYCQAQGPIAALLLMHMPEEDSFWILVQISDLYLKGYFKPGLEKVQIDGQALFNLFKKENTVAYKLMRSQGIDPILYMTEWFMCVFSRTLPWCTVLRVWDMFFCEGVKVLYRVGLHLMLSAFSDKQKFQRCQSQGMYETLNLLKNLPIESLREDKLVIESSLIKISEDDLKRAFDKSSKEFKKQADELNKSRKQVSPASPYKNNMKKK